MKKRVYIETTIVSYLTAKPSRDLILAAHQQITRDWWEERRDRYDLFASQLVLDEARNGDPEAANKRLLALSTLPQLLVTEQAFALANRLIAGRLLPQQAAGDAIHLTVAAVQEMDVLLTWNCRHLANAQILGEIGRFLRHNGYELPIVCTPEELMGDAGE